jgi:hypothetical protein
MYEQKVLNIEATGDTWINRHDKSTMYEFIYTIESPDTKSLPPDADGNIRIKANHKTPNSPFQIGQIVDFQITRESGPGHPHNGKATKPGQGNFQNSRPAQPASQPTAQPSSNGEPSLSFEETKAKAEEKRAKAIHDSVVFKGAVDMWVAHPDDSLGKIAVRARALMQLCSCVDIPEDQPVISNEEIPF